MQYDPFDLTGQAEREAGAEEAQKLEARQFGDDLKAVMDLPAGRRFVWRLLEQAGVYRASFSGEETHRMAFLEGERNQGLRVLNQIFATCPGSYAVMQQEAHERQQRNDHGNRNDRNDRNDGDR